MKYKFSSWIFRQDLLYFCFSNNISFVLLFTKLNCFHYFEANLYRAFFDLWSDLFWFRNQNDQNNLLHGHRLKPSILQQIKNRSAVRKKKNWKLIIWDWKIAYNYATPECFQNTTCGMVRGHFILPLKWFSTT